MSAELHGEPGPFDLIYCDPPWKYERNAFWAHGALQGEAAFAYDLLDLDQLCGLRTKLDVFAAKDCILFMWVTWPRLDWAMRLGEAWGFEYITCGFVWVKTSADYHPGQLCLAHPTLENLTDLGLGFHARGNTEFCLLWKRGKPGIFEDRNIRQLVFEPRREHSRKPDEVRRRIEQAYPNARRLEMFARDTCPGWSSWGNQVGKFGEQQRGAT